jgi:hypothetical protein
MTAVPVRHVLQACGFHFLLIYFFFLIFQRIRVWQSLPATLSDPRRSLSESQVNVVFALKSPTTSPRGESHAAGPIDYRLDNRRFWLSAHNCQVPTPTSQNLELEQQIRIFQAKWLT